MPGKDFTLSHEFLLQILHYDPDTGIFTCLEDIHRNAKKGDVIGFINNQDYMIISMRSTYFPAHRLAWFYMTGKWPVDMLDHINQDRTDNRFCNLREATNTTNQRNVGITKNNTSGCTGVNWESQSKKWRVRIHENSKIVFIKQFDSYQKAIAVRKALEAFYGYHPNHGKHHAPSHRPYASIR